MRRASRRQLPLVLFLSIAAIPACVAGDRTATDRKSSASHISFESPVLQPFAYTHFCQLYTGDCQSDGAKFRKPDVIELTPAKKLELQSTNSEVNDSIAPLSHQGDETYATWRIGPAYGDCNDYAVTKRHRLMALGWPAQALLLAEVVTLEGIHHLILVARTRWHDYVLDNLTTQIYSWEDTPYQWIRIQSPYDPVLWSTVKPLQPRFQRRVVSFAKTLGDAKS